MGKGDKKSRRGKIILGTYGVRRPKKKAETAPEPQKVVAAQKPVKEKKEKAVAEVKETKAPVVREHKPKTDKAEKAEKAEKPKKEKKA